MHSPAKNTPVRPARAPSKQGFTLIELLMVIAVILILAGITFGIARGVQNAQARARAKADLAAISQAIEQFKSQYGDYPWHKQGEADTNKTLLYALTGRLVLADPNPNDTTNEIKAVIITDQDEIEKKPKFLDDTKFSTSSTGNETTNLLDPWGNPYIYWYKWDNSSGDWEVFGYHLYSTGPTGAAANTKIKTKIDLTTGVIDTGFRDVANAAGIIFTGE
ncbi:MAG: prepilin-type N-terminal cleavage/methylation domain-containing protein [Opitutales bacterium]|nr:prepilin-type N-terminal cleavage/methylation domain-containing protein [Opitutales bacterium]MDP5080887.1 prepilin-type N-terminal cleavage/methylation domain-containing protein [Opitutales bacterium]